MENDKRLLRNQVMMREYLKKINNHKSKNKNMFYTTHGGHYNKNLDLDPHTNPLFMPILGQVMMDVLESQIFTKCSSPRKP